MINAKQVITIKTPFPNISSELAVRPHMYICLSKTSSDKTLIKCQTFKPHHLQSNKKPFVYLIENADISRNPFKWKTTIDCDKSFKASNVEFCSSLLTRRRSDVCDELFNDIKRYVSHYNYKVENLNAAELSELNHRVRVLN